VFVNPKFFAYALGMTIEELADPCSVSMIKMDGVVKNERSEVVSVGNWDAYVMRM
jgi:hypothetical protein